MLLLAFPKLKADPGPVTQQLVEANAPSAIMTVWQELVQQDIQPVDEEDDF
jgi:hypothetical protein